jgi:hypothetical protein
VERDFLEAAIPDRFVILGQRLRPFALGHLMLLRRLGNGFVTAEDASVDDLLQGVFLCCQTFEEGWEALQDPKLPKLIRKWGRKLGPFNIALKIQEFARYIELGSTYPGLHDPDDDSDRMPGAPYIQRVRVVLQSKLGASLSEALNYPWGLAQHDYYCFWELEERARIMNADEVALANDEGGVLAAFDRFSETPEFQAWLSQAKAACGEES